MNTITIVADLRITATEADALIREALPKVSFADRIVIDLIKTQYISSSAFRAFLIINKALKACGKDTLNLINVSELVMEYLKIAGFDEIVKIC